MRWLLSGIASALVLSGAAYIAGIRINHSPSMPEGLWHVTKLTEAARLGDMVLICPEEPIAHRYLGAGTCKSGSEPMLKPVAATAGDMVSVSAAGIAVNGELLPHTSAKTRDGAGRPLQPFAVGEYKVGAGELWAVAPHDWSYDSRYLGPIPALWLIAKASPVLLWGYHDKEGDTWQTSLQLRF